METKMLVEKISEIELTEEMQERMIKKCYMEMEESKVRKNTTLFFRKPMIAVASFIVCLCLTGVTALAATGKLQGFFKDIVRWDGAVTGTSYEQATEEVELRIATVSDELMVEMTMVNPQIAPYSSFETFGIESYKIVDRNGNVIVEGEATEQAEVAGGKVNVNIPLDNISRGEYTLIVSELLGSAKADQPLVIRGKWECEFGKR